MDDTPPAVYRRRPVSPEHNVQQQAADAWNAAEELGYEVTRIDSVSLEGEEPRRC